MELNLKGKTAIVTGASGGIGTAIVKDLIDEDVNLSLSYNRNKVFEFDLGKSNSKIICNKCDVTNIHDVKKLVELTVNEFGNIDILIHNAGIGMKGSIEKTTIDDWDKVININLKSAFLFAKEVIPIMKQQKYGRIINIGSVVAKTATNARPWLDPESSFKTGGGAYAASKAGVHSLTKTLAKELAIFNISVNCIAPGPVQTNMVPVLPEPMKDQVPLKRIGMPEEISAFVTLLASERSGFMTGEIIDINGGLWMD